MRCISKYSNIWASGFECGNFNPCSTLKFSEKKGRKTYGISSVHLCSAFFSFFLVAVQQYKTKLGARTFCPVCSVHIVSLSFYPFIANDLYYQVHFAKQKYCSRVNVYCPALSLFAIMFIQALHYKSIHWNCWAGSVPFARSLLVQIQKRSLKPFERFEFI